MTTPPARAASGVSDRVTLSGHRSELTAHAQHHCSLPRDPIHERVESVQIPGVVRTRSYRCAVPTPGVIALPPLASSRPSPLKTRPRTRAILFTKSSSQFALLCNALERHLGTECTRRHALHLVHRLGSFVVTCCLPCLAVVATKDGFCSLTLAHEAI